MNLHHTAHNRADRYMLCLAAAVVILTTGLPVIREPAAPHYFGQTASVAAPHAASIRTLSPDENWGLLFLEPLDPTVFDPVPPDTYAVDARIAYALHALRQSLSS